MNQTPFLVTRATFTKAILIGHLVNIVLGIIVFSSLHFMLGYETIVAVVATIISTTLGAILSSIIATKKLSAPVHALSNEITVLHEKVNASTNALTQMSSDAKALLEELPVGVITFDESGKLTRINETAQRNINLNIEDSESNLNAEAVLKQLSYFRSNGKEINFADWLNEAKTSKIQAVQFWQLVALRDEEGTRAYDIIARYNKSDPQACEVILILVDRTEDYLKQEKQMEFISLAAHELRGPITVMRGIVDVFKTELSPQLSQDHQDLLIRMGVSARQLAGYVENILSVSRIEKETFEVRREEVNWPLIIERSVEDLSIRATAHHRKLSFTIPPDLPTVAADPIAITHVITNLVDNAIKYSKEDGQIIVKSVLKDGEVETTVQDFGIGIPTSVVDNLFTKFYRSHKSKQLTSGTGLGLYLCKTIIEAHGGTIWVRSSEDRGTTFGFTLPVYASVAQELKNKDNQTNGIIRGSHGWIKNHSLYRR